MLVQEMYVVYAVWCMYLWRQSAGVWLGISLGLRPANERRRYIVTTSLIDWAHI